ncbi:MAG: 50S ribosomal protein L11 methyltransferase [Rhodospirillaceae bacterium]
MTWTVSYKVVFDERPDPYGEALYDRALAVSFFQDPEGPISSWQIDVLFEQEPDPADLAARLATVAAQYGHEHPTITIIPTPKRDWVSETLSSFKPIRIGRFYVHGSHHRGSAPLNSLPLIVDATIAFGTGEHPTTKGCLLALDSLAKRSRFRRLIGQTGGTPILDIGCGTAILAMAAARCWPVNVLATDIDTEAVGVARMMVIINGLAARVFIVRANGFAHRQITARAPYALITANILARPLCAMARDLSIALAPRGRLILSGILLRQIPMVRSAYQLCGLSLERKISIGEWSTLVFKR